MASARQDVRYRPEADVLVLRRLIPDEPDVGVRHGCALDELHDGFNVHALPAGKRRQQPAKFVQQYRTLLLVETGISCWIDEAQADAFRLVMKETAEVAQYAVILDGAQNCATLILPMDINPHTPPPCVDSRSLANACVKPIREVVLA